MSWTHFREACETVSYVSVALALVLTFVAYHNNLKKEGMDSALGIYRELNHAYGESIKTCLEHPRLDCYDKPEVTGVSEPLDEKERIQQKILYDMFTNLFESAYVHFVKYREQNSKEVNELFNSQWEAWENYIERFLERPAYLSVWIDVNDVYDDGLRCHVRNLIRKDQQKLLNETLQSDETLRKRLTDWLKQMEQEQKKKGLTCGQ